MKLRDEFRFKIRPAPNRPGFNIGGHFWAKGTDWQGRRFKHRLKNGITLAGLNSILAVYFTNATQLPNWYMGLIDNASFTGINNTDTMASHAGWTENVQYSGGARPAWNTLSVGGQTITNVSDIVFTLSMNVVIAGLFLVSDSTLSGTAGMLWSTGLFPAGPQTLIGGSVLEVGYTLSGSPV
jgi:hypothetical protein